MFVALNSDSNNNTRQFSTRLETLAVYVCVCALFLLLTMYLIESMRKVNKISKYNLLGAQALCQLRGNVQTIKLVYWLLRLLSLR